MGHNRIFRSTLVLLLIALGVHFVESRGYLHGLQMALSLDPMVKGAAPTRQMDVSVVTIDEYDYQQYFCGKSPLDGRALLALVNGVKQTLHPLVIGVDLDTSDWNGGPPASCPGAEKLLCKQNEDPQACLAGAERLLPELENSPSPLAWNPLNGVVWAQVPAGPRVVPSEQDWWARLLAFIKALWTGEPEDDTALPLQTVAGRRIPRDVRSTGIPRFPLDPDGVVRRYRRSLRVIDEFGAKNEVSAAKAPEMSSLPYALVEALGPPLTNEQGAAGDETILRFLADAQGLVPIEAKYLMPTVEGQAAAAPPDDEQIKKALAMRPNRVVLIGGTYKEARDSYRTPVGEMTGVQLVAQAVETELQGGFHEINSGLKMIGDLVAGGFLILLWSCYPRYLKLGWVFFLSLVGIYALTQLVSTGLFSRWGIWFDSVAVMAGVLIHQVIEELDKVSELKKEVDERDETIRELEQDLKVLAATHAHTAAAHAAPPDQEIS